MRGNRNRNRNRRKIIAGALCLCGVSGLLCAPLSRVGALRARAAQTGWITAESTVVNPLYEEELTASAVAAAITEAPAVSKKRLFAGGETPVRTSAGEMVVDFRAAAKKRESTIVCAFHLATVEVPAGETIEEALIAVGQSVADQAMNELTGVPDEGDYLQWCYPGYNLAVSARAGADGGYEGQFTWQMAYYSDYAQEQELSARLGEVMESLSLEGKSDVRKIEEIYRYITEHVAYDNAHLRDDSYLLKFSPYAALINGTAVCQGYATLLYRMVLTAGVDVRVIPGTTDNPKENHAWNIAKIGNCYYDLDSTWDAGAASWSWYLKCEKDFPRHVRDGNYNTEEFHAKYPMAAASYSPAEETGAQIAEEQKSDERVAEEQKSDEQAAEEQKSDEQIAEEQKSDEQIAEEQKSDERVAEETASLDCAWYATDGRSYWYEGGKRQGTVSDPKSFSYDGSIRGREIYDAATDGWYWLDANADGAKAVNKEVFMPYIYQDEADYLTDEGRIAGVAAYSRKDGTEGDEAADMSAQIAQAIRSHGGPGAGKWVRYDENGAMIKGWYRVDTPEKKALYPNQQGNVYYYDRQTGLMAKGRTTIDGQTYVFDEVTGALRQ